MKMLRFVSAAALTLFAAGAAIQPSAAQDKPVKPAKAAKAGREGRLEKILDKLDLTDAQKAQIKPIIADHHKDAMAIKKDASLTPDQKKDKLKEIGKAAHEKVLAILTPEQKAKLKELHKEHAGKAAKPAKP